MSANIIAVYIFKSSSDCDRVYQTLQYDNGSLSCDCKGWTFRRSPVRSCKHTRLVEAGLGEQQAVTVKRYRNSPATVCRGENMFEVAGRKLDLT